MSQPLMQLEAERLAAMDDSWKEEYDSRLGSWKAENAARREQSEKLRAEYERQKATEPVEEPSLASSIAPTSVGGSYVDARDLVSGEGQAGEGAKALDVSNLGPCLNFN